MERCSSNDYCKNDEKEKTVDSDREGLDDYLAQALLGGAGPAAVAIIYALVAIKSAVAGYTRDADEEATKVCPLGKTPEAMKVGVEMTAQTLKQDVVALYLLHQVCLRVGKEARKIADKAVEYTHDDN